MIAYKKSQLEAINIHSHADRWKDKNIVGAETLEKIKTAYINNLFTPNIFIRIALFIFTCILTSAALGLLTLMSIGGESEVGMGTRSMMYGLIVLAGLEIFIREKRTYRSGIDDALLYIGLSLFIVGIFMIFANIFNSKDELLFCLIALPFLIAGSIRYADRLLAGISFCCFFALIFFALSLGGTIFQSFLPFAGMLLSVAIYYLNKKFFTEQNLVWWDNLILIEVLSLFTFYLSGNYLVVREFSVGLMGLEITEGKDIPLAFIFYLFTVLIPLLYLYKGIQTKDRVMLRCGLIIFAMCILTFKYYYSLGHHEISLSLAGICMIGISWILMNYLKISRSGFTSQNDDSLLNNDIESLVIAQSFGDKKDETAFELGGGKSGGGGAGGNF